MSVVVIKLNEIHVSTCTFAVNLNAGTNKMGIRKGYIRPDLSKPLKETMAELGIGFMSQLGPRFMKIEAIESNFKWFTEVGEKLMKDGLKEHGENCIVILEITREIAKNQTVNEKKIIINATGKTLKELGVPDAKLKQYVNPDFISDPEKVKNLIAQLRK